MYFVGQKMSRKGVEKGVFSPVVNQLVSIFTHSTVSAGAHRWESTHTHTHSSTETPCSHKCILPSTFVFELVTVHHNVSMHVCRWGAPGHTQVGWGGSVFYWQLRMVQLLTVLTGEVLTNVQQGSMRTTLIMVQWHQDFGLSIKPNI